jgi:hypothetical protein
MVTERRLPATLERWAAVQQVAAFSRRQWKVAGRSYLAALLIMGVAGETLPGASAGRVVPIQWWNYVTLVLSPPLIALIAATFVPPGQPKKGRRLAKTGTGVEGLLAPLRWPAPYATRSRSRSSGQPACCHSSRHTGASLRCCRSCCSPSLCWSACALRGPVSSLRRLTRHRARRADSDPSCATRSPAWFQGAPAASRKPVTGAPGGPGSLGQWLRSWRWRRGHRWRGLSRSHLR